MNFSPNGECTTFPFAGRTTAPVLAETRSASTRPATRSVWPRRSAAGPSRGSIRRRSGVLRPVRRVAPRGMGPSPFEWQFGLGIQHEILPRLSAEFTYNRRCYFNMHGVRPVGHRLRPVQRRAGPVTTCQDGNLDYTQPLVRLLHGDRADRSAAAGRRRLSDPRAQHAEDDGARRPAGGPDSWTS